MGRTNSQSYKTTNIDPNLINTCCIFFERRKLNEEKSLWHKLTLLLTLGRPWYAIKLIWTKCVALNSRPASHLWGPIQAIKEIATLFNVINFINHSINSDNVISQKVFTILINAKHTYNCCNNVFKKASSAILHVSNGRCIVSRTTGPMQPKTNETLHPALKTYFASRSHLFKVRVIKDSELAGHQCVCAEGTFSYQQRG